MIKEFNFKIKITKALDNLWKDEEDRRKKLKILEPVSHVIEYKNNLESFIGSKSQLDFPHDQIKDSHTLELFKNNIETYFKGNFHYFTEENTENYSKCKFSHEKVRNFETNEKIEKVKHINTKNDIKYEKLEALNY